MYSALATSLGKLADARLDCSRGRGQRVAEAGLLACSKAGKHGVYAQVHAAAA